MIDRGKYVNENPQHLLQDSLRDVTRKERRALLGLAALGMVVAKTKLEVSQLTVLGLSCKSIPNADLLLYLGCLVLYFLVAFLVYVLSDVTSWWFSESDTNWRSIRTDYQLGIENQKKQHTEKHDNTQENSLSSIIPSRQQMADSQRNATGFESVTRARKSRDSSLRVSQVSLATWVLLDVILPLPVGLYAILLLFGWIKTQ
jgi:uncharacterized membrane protein